MRPPQHVRVAGAFLIVACAGVALGWQREPQLWPKAPGTPITEETAWPSTRSASSTPSASTATGGPGTRRPPGENGARGHYWPKLRAARPWHDPQAVVVGIRHITIDLDDPARQRRPQPDHDPAIHHPGAAHGEYHHLRLPRLPRPCPLRSPRPRQGHHDHRKRQPPPSRRPGPPIPGRYQAEGQSIRAYVATDDQIREVFTSYRHLDPVRAAALTAAVDLISPAAGDIGTDDHRRLRHRLGPLLRAVPDRRGCRWRPR